MANIRRLGIRDYVRVHSMYESMSNETRWKFHPSHILARWPHEIQWVPFQVALLISLISFHRVILKLCPRICILMVGAYCQEKLVGVVFLSGSKHLSNGTLVSNLSIGIMDKYQGKGIGTALMGRIASEACLVNISTIRLNVQDDNKRAKGLYRKYGFTVISTQKEHYKGCKYNNERMEVVLK